MKHEPAPRTGRPALARNGKIVSSLDEVGEKEA